MVSRAEKIKMKDFTADFFKNNGFGISSASLDEIVMVNSAGKQGSILLHNHQLSQSEMKSILRSRTHYVNLFFKGTYEDEEKKPFCRWLVGLERHARSEKSLKCYSDDQLNRIVKTRAIERDVIEVSSDSPAYGCISYYQPKSDRLGEAIVTYRSRPIDFDYSHLRLGDPGYDFARNTRSEELKLFEKKYDSSESAEPIGLAYAGSVGSSAHRFAVLPKRLIDEHAAAVEARKR